MPVFVENDAAAATMGEMQFGLGKKYQTFFYVLITAALGGSLVIDGNHFRGASGRSGELGMLRGRDATGHERQIQNIVSLSALYSRLAAQGIRVSAPHELTDLDESGQAIIDAWVEIAVDTLLDTVLAINCLVNPEAVLIGGPPARRHRRPDRQPAESAARSRTPAPSRRSRRWRAPRFRTMRRRSAPPSCRSATACFRHAPRS